MQGVEDSFLFESNVITEFLDADVFPGPKLYPVNAWERAQVKMWQDWELGLVDVRLSVFSLCLHGLTFM